MSDARWRRLQELFDALIATPPSGRGALLAALDDDDAIKHEALALAAAEDGDDSGMTGRLREAAARASTAPVEQRLGPWRLVREIGSGGMGTVFLAERVDDAFDRRVAIKLLRGIPTREATERMRRERQILADLDHPNIARLLDGGNTAQGEPYLVMEYVDGVALTDYCRRRALPIPARVQLLHKLCAAVQYAHQRLVIHRDLKPANVLVRADGEPMLLDFGIAKLLGGTGPALQTGLPWFTPAYASPEQRRGEPVSTATDVYGLGLLLHELLCDEAPKPDADGRLPSPRSIAGKRHRVPRDLDLIVARATHPEPERRYVSAAALADDLQRHLRGRPVHAAPDRLHYRAGKFLARHRYASAAMLFAIALAAMFTWRLANERDRALRAEALAREQTATAESVVDYLVALFRSASPDEAGTQPIAPRDLVDRGRRGIDQRLAGAPRQRARLLGALGQIYIELGLPAEAAESLGAAAALEASHGTPRQRAAYLLEQGYALNTGERPAEARTVLEAGLAALGDIIPDEFALAADILATLGLAQAREGDAATGTATVRRALDYAAKADGEDSVRYAEVLYALADTGMREGRLEAAEGDALRSLGILRRHLPEDSNEVIAASGFLSQVYERQGRHADAERLLRDMLERRLRTLDPGSSWAVTARNNLAQAILSQGRLVEAMGLMRENIEHLRAGGQQESPSYLIALNNLASLVEMAGDHRASLAMFEEVVERARRHEDFPHAEYFRTNLGRSYVLNGRLDDARALLERTPEAQGEPSHERRIEQARRTLNLAEWSRRSGQPEAALVQLDAAIAALAMLHPESHAREGGAAVIRGLVLRDLGRIEAAAVEFRRAVDLLARYNGKDANATLDAELQLSETLLRLGRIDEARALHARLTPLLPARFVEASPVRLQHAALARRLQATSVASRK